MSDPPNLWKKVLRDSAAWTLRQGAIRNAVLKNLFRRGAAIFMFHRVLPAADVSGTYDPEIVVTTETFDGLLETLRQEFQVLPLLDLAARLERESLAGERWCAITFDDGWADNHTHAFPLLRKHGLPATIFISTDFIGSSLRFWQDRLGSCLRVASEKGIDLRGFWSRKAPGVGHRFTELRWYLLHRPESEVEGILGELEQTAGMTGSSTTPSFLTWEQVREMNAAGIEFGSHTVSHQNLVRQTLEGARSEIVRSREILQQELGLSRLGFSFPRGTYSLELARMVERAGYEYGVTGYAAMAPTGCSRFVLPRIFLSESILGGPDGGFREGLLYLQLARIGRSRLPSSHLTAHWNDNASFLFAPTSPS